MGNRKLVIILKALLLDTSTGRKVHRDPEY